MHPRFSLGQCPICEGGLCGIRICGIDSPHPHGLVVCDECEAIWRSPDLSSPHQYTDSVDARCPVCARELWGENSRWADWDDVVRLGWQSMIDPGLIWDEDGAWQAPPKRPIDPLEPPSSGRSEIV